MSLTMWLVIPFFLAALGLIAFLSAKRLGFISREARHLDKIDIPNEVREIRLNELEMLLCEEADRLFRTGWELSLWERREAVSRRFRAIRKWLHLIMDNAGIFHDIARFHLLRHNPEKPESDSNERELAKQIATRATAVHFMAAICLGKLLLLDLYRIVWPFYQPDLAGRFQVRGLHLISWYRHMAIEMLKFAHQYYDDITYTRFILQLTGVFTVEDASGLNRL